ncbi:MAG: response regulator transcription factor [Chloroflexi bacterium]|nr:response regulator transcription factor [Chloroflexota bacterium]
MKVLVVEDAPEIVESIKLCVAIRWPESQVMSTAQGSQGLQLVESEAPDVVILDLGLPDMDGLDVLREVRRFSDVPVLVVTAKGDEVSRVKGLETGADDYIVKPFSHTELLARMRAVLRRSHLPQLWGDEGVVRGKGLSVDLAARRVFVDGQEAELTPSEWNLLSYFVRNEGRIIPLPVLAEKVWGSAYVESSSIKMCVRRLRLKLRDNTKSPQLVRSHRGLGYSFVMPRW